MSQITALLFCVNVGYVQLYLDAVIEIMLTGS